MKKMIKKIAARLTAPSKYDQHLSDSGIYLMYTTYAERGWRHTGV